MGAPLFTLFLPKRDHRLLRPGMLPSRYRAFSAPLAGGEKLWIATWAARVTAETHREYVAVGVDSAQGREERDASEQEVAWAFEFLEIRRDSFDEAIDGEHRLDAERVMKFVREQPPAAQP